MANRSSSWLSRLVKSNKSPSDNGIGNGRTPPSPDPTPADDVAETDTRARRREQVRRAQRTHRDRRAAYLKALESEVARLRARDSAHEAEIQTYKQTIQELKDLLSHHSIPLPLHLASDPHVTGRQATIEVVGFPDHSQSIRAYIPEGHDGFTSHLSPTPTFPASSESTMSSNEMLARMNISEAANINQISSLNSFNTVSVPMPHAHGLDSSQVGVEFILGLEHVCLYHVDLHNGSRDSNGHTLMLSSPIMARSPPLTQTTQPGPGTGLPDGTRWCVPAVELERLLEFSDRLDLSGEITPVEAWQRIRQHPNFSNLTRDGLEALKASLTPHVKCHGFGAVMDEIDFEHALHQALGPGQ
ncbi:hypothetical protein A1O3_00136 [Capronia epimyces CBS 606.96]|uniref:BZIP domain-containing protein n=1 Tax=Capronia epimyces CBS 606.96 TaxID=1182542 RepID=W9YGC0_9EURO|nr:uncharacterized protein A1O3_00136 [Capronia epimyces CBS 606.96]EXJ91588.1 hypothetical protein A1O3_00136 [Capronia epimyces CBS 606.96]